MDWFVVGSSTTYVKIGFRGAPVPSTSEGLLTTPCTLARSRYAVVEYWQLVPVVLTPGQVDCPGLLTPVIGRNILTCRLHGLDELQLVPFAPVVTGWPALSYSPATILAGPAVVPAHVVGGLVTGHDTVLS